MAHILEEAEDLIYIWIMTLPEADQRNLHNGADIINSITNDAEEDIKNELWQSIKNSLSYRSILNRLVIYLNEIVQTQSVEESESESEPEEEEPTDQGSTD
jgi:hypothetical protein